jgi:hypothetical protein
VTGAERLLIVDPFFGERVHGLIGWPLADWPDDFTRFAAGHGIVIRPA